MGASLSMGACCTVPPPISHAPPLPPAEAGQRLSGGGEAVVGPTEVVDLVVDDALKPLPPETPTRTTTGRPPSQWPRLSEPLFHEIGLSLAHPGRALMTAYTLPRRPRYVL